MDLRISYIDFRLSCTDLSSLYMGFRLSYIDLDSSYISFRPSYTVLQLKYAFLGRFDGGYGLSAVSFSYQWLEKG